MQQVLVPDTIEGWMSRLAEAEIPVLRRSVRQLKRLREDEDRVDPQLIAEQVLRDPLMTLKVLRRVVSLRSRRIVTDTETVTAAVLLMGVPPFFREFDGQQVLEDRFEGRRDALRGLLSVMRRAHRAALFSVGFAVHRQDAEAELLYEAALLHDFVEMLLWCHEPDLAMEIEKRKRADPSLRSSTAQLEVLGVHLEELEQALLKHWGMPEALIRLTSDDGSSKRIRNVQLAVQLARHSDSGWSNPALPDDLIELADLLNLSVESARRKVFEIDG